MCTVIVGNKLFPDYPLVIAANRDEMLDRPALPPQFSGDAPRTLMPRDAVRGGTWIGVNAHGVFAALTNRVDVTSLWDPECPLLMKSRGEIVPRALTHSSAVEAIDDLVRLHTRAYNGFNLIVGDARALFVLRGNGATGREHPDLEQQSDESGLLVVSNLGVGQGHSPRAEAIAETWCGSLLFNISRPHHAVWNRLLTIHDPEARLEDGWMKRMASTCIHRPPEENYGTRSSAFVVLSTGTDIGSAPAWNYWHRERPTNGYACQGTWDPARTLPIQE